MTPESVQLRPATRADCDLIFGWRNLPEIVELGSLSREVTLDEHTRWFQSSLVSKDRRIYIIESAGKPVGQIRFDHAGDHIWELSMYLIPGHTGAGLGSPALHEGCRLMWEEHGALTIQVRVRTDNPRSKVFFIKGGFTPRDSSTPKSGHFFLQLSAPKLIPHNRLTTGKEEENAVAAVARSGKWAGDKVLRELEVRISDVAGADVQAVGVGSGLGALRLALHALGIVAGDSVAVPAYSCVALANAVLACGALPVAIEIESGSWNISPEALALAKTNHPELKAVIAVHTFGFPANLKALESVGLPVIEDCSHAFGRGGFGGMGDIAILSLYATKLLGGGEGGMVMTRSAEMATLVRQARDYVDKPPAAWRLNDKMTDLEAAIALCQLRRLPDLLARRDEKAERYHALLTGRLPDGTLPLPHNQRIWYRYVLDVTAPDSLIRQLACSRIGAARPVDDWRLISKAQPLATHAYARLLSLPLYPSLTESEQNKVVESLLRAMHS